MCVKIITKQFYVVMNFAKHLKHPAVVTVVPSTYSIDKVYKESLSTEYLSNEQVRALGYSLPQDSKCKLYPISLNRDALL